MLTYAGYPIKKWKALMGNPNFPNRCWATFWVEPGACFSVKLAHIEEQERGELRNELEKVFGVSIFTR